jgi:hypothetical protein
MSSVSTKQLSGGSQALLPNGKNHSANDNHRVVKHRKNCGFRFRRISASLRIKRALYLAFSHFSKLRQSTRRRFVAAVEISSSSSINLLIFLGTKV